MAQQNRDDQRTQDIPSAGQALLIEKGVQKLSTWTNSSGASTECFSDRTDLIRYSVLMIRLRWVKPFPYVQLTGFVQN